MLGTSRALFAHSYFVYEFLVVAVTWSLLAVEAALRDVLRTGQGRSAPGFGKLVAMAQGRGWLNTHEADALRAGKQLRDSLVHVTGVVHYTPGLAEPMLSAGHAAVADIYRRSAGAQDQ